MNLEVKKKHKEIKFVNVEKQLINAKKLIFPQSSKSIAIMVQSPHNQYSQRFSTKTNPKHIKEEKKREKLNCKVNKINKNFNRLSTFNRNNIKNNFNLPSSKNNCKCLNEEKKVEKSKRNSDNYVSKFKSGKINCHISIKRSSYEKRKSKNIFSNKINMDDFLKEKKTFKIKKKNEISFKYNNKNSFREREMTKKETEENKNFINDAQNQNNIKEKEKKETIKKGNINHNFKSFKKIFCCCL